MFRKYKKIVNKAGMTNEDLVEGELSAGYKLFSAVDYIKFMFFCTLLIVPLYAIADSVINRNWIMVIVDALLVPVGFVHGLLLLFGMVD